MGPMPKPRSKHMRGAPGAVVPRLHVLSTYNLLALLRRRAHPQGVNEQTALQRAALPHVAASTFDCPVNIGLVHLRHSFETPTCYDSRAHIRK